MITVFNRVKLMTDSSPEEAARVWDLLKQNGIPYTMKTLKNHTTFGRNLHARAAINTVYGGLGHSPFADQMRYTYVIYVSRKDAARAKAVIG